MAFCSNCGKEIAVDAQFCSGCGVAVDAPNKSEKEQRKTVYDGDLHKCPNCGEPLNSFVSVCPSCKYELRSTNTTSYIHKFSLQLEQVNNVEARIDLIKNFYIPNTKEEIYEFFILAISNIAVGGKEDEAWLTKLEQAFLKAKLTFGDSKEYERIQKMYEGVDKAKIKKQIHKSKTNTGLILFVIGLVITLSLFVSMPIFSPLGICLVIAGVVLWIISDQQEKNSKRR